MRLGTHDGTFHADDCCAVAVVQLAHPDETVEVVRTRDADVLAACDLRVDVGFRHDPTTGDFDHHQGGGAGAREDGVPYASFGLVWSVFGEAICARLGGGADPAALAARVDLLLVAGVDANDVGMQVVEPAFDGAPPIYALSWILGALNPVWDADADDAAQDAAFAEGVELARGVLQREIARQAADLRAADVVRAGIAGASDPRIVELERDVPWRRWIIEEAPEALFVLYPKSRGWGVQAIPADLGTFENRRSLPAAWGGLQREELAQVTGVPDAVFCHTARFLAVAESRAGALRLAELALVEE